MLEIIYFSNFTNNTHRFIEKLNWENKTHRIPVRGNLTETLTTNPYVLICPSYGEKQHGHVPPQVRKFLTNPDNRKNCVGVIGAGNINFGPEYARSGDVISFKLKIPLLYKFELAGTTEDYEKITIGLQTLQKQLQN